MKDWIKKVKQIDRAITSTVAKVANNVQHNSLYTDGGAIDLSTLFNTPIDKYCMIEMADRQLLRFMSINLMEKNVTLNNIGNSTLGISNHVSDEVHLYDYSYTEGNNYLHDYQMMADNTTTQTKLDSNNFQNYHKNGHNTLYGITMNTYPDDNDTGTDKFGSSKKWGYYDANNNRNSILYKTKQLFRERKINTIISRFHTDNMDLKHNDTSETARSVYGLSHGRNLLTYDAERNGISYDRNGYNNPYCRVWTHHHQYSEERSRLMRPFYNEDAWGNVEAKMNTDLHRWDNFEDTLDGSTKIVGETEREEIDYNSSSTAMGFLSGNYSLIKKKKVKENIEEAGKWSWKDSGSEGWKYSVLNNETGLLNIAPKFLGGAEKNIHAKDCMFSIENLAWQGYDPYSFETALSWEQRGPFGGRIMWFPPYGLRFSEDASVNWNEHSFIGRGENVFTYTNTSRSGTLEFMMVVDHPSILDYATWHNPSDLKDTDVFRFFAGCDSSSGSGTNGGNNGILQSFARPTPLTDEYLDSQDNTEAPIPIRENQKPEPEPPKEPEAPAPDEEFEIRFYAFFPNNYSGAFDRENNTFAKNNQTGKVDPIAYLLFGKGASWECVDDDVTKAKNIATGFDEHLEIFSSGTDYNGYEMKNSGTKLTTQNTDKNYIIGTGKPGGYGSTRYSQTNSKKWYYRIDGEYVGGITYNAIENTFGQTLTGPKSYQDTATYQFNSNVDSVAEAFDLKDDVKKNTYTLAEMAYVLLKTGEGENKYQKKVRENSGLSDTQMKERTKDLFEYFSKDENNIYKIMEVSCVGFSNSHGINRSTSTNNKRNQFLAEQRRETVLNWFKKYYGEVNVNDGPKTAAGQKVGKGENESGKIAKKWRSARMNIKIKKSSVSETKDLNQAKNHENNSKLIVKTVEEMGNTIDASYKPYEYEYFGEMPMVKQYMSVDEYERFCLLNPNEEQNFKISKYAKTIKNIISGSDIVGVDLDDYERYTFILKACDKEISDYNFTQCMLMQKGTKKEIISVEEYENLSEEDKDLYTIYQYKVKEDKKTDEQQEAEQGFVRFTGFVECEGEIDPTYGQLYINTNETDEAKKERRWYYDQKDKAMKLLEKSYTKKTLRNNSGWSAEYGQDFNVGKDYNSLRYDQEYHFFKQLEAKHPDVFSSVVEKLQYFDPAYHSMTPEGFMGRLNFLHQCTRQGDTISASDKNGHMANNLAFGRPPFCILRLGDFYYQKIVIRNINITYDPLVLDLNNEGVGVVPLIANVTITFNFIGGGDLTGPVRRLQNAMAHNFYANGRLYDNRADRVERLGTGNWDTMDMGEVDFRESHFHHVQVKKPN